MAVNPWFTAAEQTLPEYIPLPMQQLVAAGQAVQGRHDTNMANIDATATGLASIEALSPAHREYVSNLASGYRSEIDGLLQKYNNNATDPQFTREFSRIRNKYATDPNLSVITQANQKLKRNQELAARLNAEGRLFVNDTGVGVDAQGNLIDDVGDVRQVNTLDNLRERLKIASGTETEVGNLITNRPALEQARTEILNSLSSGSPEFVDLTAAYMNRGLSQEQALNQVAQDVQRLSGEYAINEKTNFQKLNYQRALANDARDAEYHRLRMADLKSKMNPQSNTPNPLRGVMLKGIVSATDLNKDKVSLVNSFRNHIGKDGNLDIKNKQLQVSAFGAHANSIEMGSNIQGRSVAETLNYMRDELGWGNKKGSAKQVADAYESMIKNDNLVPVVYAPGNSTIRTGLSNIYGSDFTNATYYKDGKPKRLEDNKEIVEAQKNANLKGITTMQGGNIVFNSFIGNDAITVTIPMDDNMKTLMNENLQMSTMLESYKDNTALWNDIKKVPERFALPIGNDVYMPRKTAQGLRYAKINVNPDGSFELDRDNNRSLRYLPDNLVKQALLKEYSNLDNLLETIIK